jgi:hypothetical protein
MRSETWSHRRVCILIASLLLIVWVALKVPLVSPYSFEWDSAQFSLGALDFDPLHHQPHPPGFPLWILCIKLVSSFGASPNTSQIILSALFALAAMPACFGLGRRLSGDFGGLTACALVLYSPTLLLYSSVASTYPAEMCASCWCAYFCARLIEGEFRLVVPIFVLLALTAGVRLGGAIFLLPVVAYALFRVGAVRHWRPITAGTAIAAIVVFLSYLPVAINGGGYPVMIAKNRELLWIGMQGYSPLFVAAPLARMLLVNTALFFGTALSGIVAACLIGLARTRGASAILDDRNPPLWDRWLFWIAWIGPNLLFLIVHCPKSGYVLFSLPALVLLLYRTFLRRSQWEGALVAGLAINLFVALFPIHLIHDGGLRDLLRPVLRSTPEAGLLGRDGNRELDNVLAGIQAYDGATLLVSLRHEIEGPNIRTLVFDRPSFLVAFPNGGKLNYAQNRKNLSLSAVPENIKRIVWLGWATPLSESIRRGFPGTEHLYTGSDISVWMTPIGANGFDVTADSAVGPFRVFRPGQASP